MTATATVSFRTTPELKQRVSLLAKKTRRSTSFYYNLLLDEYLSDLEDIYLSEEVAAEIKSGKQKTYPAEEVYKELDLEDSVTGV